jgi:hypothetical protein
VKPATLVLALWLLVPASARADGGCAHPETLTPATLAGAWQLVAAEAVRADGNRVSDYGAAPRGLWMVDLAGRYTLQIYAAARPRFAAGDKRKATAAENAAAVAGASTHLGRVELDAARTRLRFRIEAALFPNWEGETQERRYDWCPPLLSYYGRARPDGAVPVTVWRRIDREAADRR